MSSTSSREPSDGRHHSRSSTNQSASSFFTYPVSYAVSGLLRRLNSDASTASAPAAPTSRMTASLPTLGSPKGSGTDGVYTPPLRTASPFQPPPLTPLSLSGYREGTLPSARLMNKTLAEEIRLLVPPRLQLVENWKLVYSLEEHGVSLATLYQKCEEYRGKRGSFVLAVKDGEGSAFGAYLSDPPHPTPHFYGTGECFLWRASILPSIPNLDFLPLPPSADTTNATRMTTLGGATKPKKSKPIDLLTGDDPEPSQSGTATPERIRFKAFPYSGVNDYMIFCEHGYLSVGGGDGHYGLWLDDNLEHGVSDSCPTFGNECLSEEGNKFEVIGVELWYIGV